MDLAHAAYDFMLKKIFAVASRTGIALQLASKALHRYVSLL